MKVLIACGGTAGHIFPGLALVEELKKGKDPCQIVMVVSSRRRDKEFLSKMDNYLLEKVCIERVDAIALPYRFSFKYIPFLIKLFWAALKSFIIILRYRPQVVVGFGGYTSFAPLVVAHIIGIPTLVHEQNLMPGRANRFLSRIADKIATSFEETDKFLPRMGSGKRVIKTGLPLRGHLLNYSETSSDPTLSKLRVFAKKFTVLVVGGSQGAHNINELVLKCLGQMNKIDLGALQVIHLAGKRDAEYVKRRYEALGVVSCVFDFLEDMASAYRIADLVISRSGAGAIFEAATFGLPCILIPHSYGTQHQRENALFLERSGAAVVLDEKTASAKDLGKIMLELIGNERRREDLSQKIKTLGNPQASRDLKEQILSLCNRG